MMIVVSKKESEIFLRTINLDIPDKISSFTMTCIDLETGLDVTSSILFSEDSVYQDVDIGYGEGRYGGMPDNQLSSVTFGIKAGVLGKLYKISINVITELASQHKIDIILEIVSKMDGFFEKQVFDKFTIELDYSNILYDEDIRYTDSILSQTVIVTRKSDNVIVTDDVIFASAIVGSDKVQIGVKDGTSNELYNIVNNIITTQGYAHQLDILMKVNNG